LHLRSLEGQDRSSESRAYPPPSTCWQMEVFAFASRSLKRTNVTTGERKGARHLCDRPSRNYSVLSSGFLSSSKLRQQHFGFYRQLRF
jgi:hypothetical protein